MAVATKIKDAIERSSWIRKMFEEGVRLKALHGPDKVYDFSLGNPDLEPPEKFGQVLGSVVAESSTGAHGYMPNAGYELFNPRGAFYLFPKSPIADEVSFVRLLQEENILVVPGSGFGSPGYFRIAYCVGKKTIESAMPGFIRARERILAKR